MKVNTLVVYDSQYGNTECIAQTIAEALRAYGSSSAIRIEPAQPLALKSIDLLILGCPTQAFGPTLAMRQLLVHMASTTLDGVEVACFDTRIRGPFGSAAHRMARQLRSIGVPVVVPPESFLVMGK